MGREELNMKNNYKIIAVILLVAAFVCLFIPGVLKEETWEYSANSLFYHGISTLRSRVPCSFLDINSTSGTIFAWVVIVDLIATAGILLLSVLKQIEHKVIYYLPCASLLLFMAFIFSGLALCARETSSYLYIWVASWLSYIVLFFLISAAVLTLVAKKSTATVKEKQHLSDRKSLDVLTEYKKLFDDGIITQEEFEAKKKQFLGL